MRIITSSTSDFPMLLLYLFCLLHMSREEPRLAQKRKICATD
jgi:hypothetical protein